MMKRLKHSLISLVLAGLLALLPTASAFAHEGPEEGAEWLMADWMLLTFLVFFMTALIVFVIALKRGLLSNLEEAKYYILTIDEPDYYSPDWAKEDPDAKPVTSNR